MKEINPGEQIVFPGERKVKVELDKRALFALASDTRLDILKALTSERRTVSQLAEELQVDKSAVHRHLKKLEEGGLVLRTDDHGFIYYALTWKARDIISPGENTKIVFLISSVFLLLLVVSVIMLAVNPQASGPGEVESSTSGDYGVPGTSDQADRTLEYTSVGSLALVMVTATYFVTRKLWRPKQPRPHESEGLMFDDPGED